MGLGSAPQPQFTHFLCVSPDAPTNPVLYWVGNFDAKNTRFLLEGAHGPTKLDLGDVLYAPNLMKDAKVQSKAAWCAAQDGIQAVMHQGLGSMCMRSVSGSVPRCRTGSLLCLSLRVGTEHWPARNSILSVWH